MTSYAGFDYGPGCIAAYLYKKGIQITLPVMQDADQVL